MRILITDGDARAALAIVRSLGRRGHEIHVGEKKYFSLSSVSKYCSHKLIYPDPIEQSEIFLEVLIHYVKDQNIEAVLPVTDVTTMNISDNRSRFEPYCHIPLSDARAIATAANKCEVMRIAERLKVAIPKTVFLESADMLPSVLDDIAEYPQVIKPSRSRIYNDGRWFSTSVSYAYSIEEARKIIEDKSAQEFPVILQERITGPGIGIFVCYNRGELISVFSHRRLREKPPSGGVSTLRESIPPSPEATEYAKRLLDHLNWHGVAMVEFKLDERDKRVKLMEINGRFWGSLQLAIDSGVDFPVQLIETINCRKTKFTDNYKHGVKTRWLWGDLDALLMVLFKRGRKLKLPKGHDSRFHYLSSFLKMFEKELHYEVESFSDMKPCLYEACSRLFGSLRAKPTVRHQRH